MFYYVILLVLFILAGIPRIIKSKHIELRHHWIRDALERKEMQLEKVDTDDNGADMFTKVLSQLKLQECKKIAGMKAREGGNLLMSLAFLP